eukprot:gnl/TRDRNA2_/TRDRNA2_174828_c9_seq1.p1 gnl/TRDRNA2_/TRDRNA2_174828_c9~~gnl/TRDRNA2_/TRDRNA2_174828_c9_seq1.p1  ORF type:complete len:168 (-),score=21.06 gnl/TRDRNA2_/TRDRNA2_174828_c9_seq1:94-573(-)
MSAGHNVAVGNPDNYVFASDALVGNSLITRNGTALVTSRSQVTKMGIYAPWTMTSNLYVGAGEEFFLAHGLANVPSRFENFLNFLFSILNFVFPSVHDLDEDSGANYMHPVVRSFWSIVGTFHHDYKDSEPSRSRKKDRMHPLGSLVASIASTPEDIFV